MKTGSCLTGPLLSPQRSDSTQHVLGNINAVVRDPACLVAFALSVHLVNFGLTCETHKQMEASSHFVKHFNVLDSLYLVTERAVI